MTGRQFRTKLLRSALVGTTLVFVPTLMVAQVSAGAVPMKGRFIGAPRNTCQQMAAMPSPLVGSPEGRVLLNMQRDLSSVSTTMALRPDSSGSRSAARKVAILRHGVDSLARIYIQNIDSTSPRAMRTPDGVERSTNAKFDSARVFLRAAPLSELTREQFEVKLRELEPQVRQLARGQYPTSIEFVLSRTASAPGYLGVTSSSEAVTTIMNGVERVGYCDYPVVESIEPGSPADKAGILTGDTLIAYNGLDLREFDVIYGQLLIPGRAVFVRFRRGGKEREIPIVVARRGGDHDAGNPQAQCDDTETRAACEAKASTLMRGFMFPPPPSRMSPDGGFRKGGSPGARGGDNHMRSVPGVPMTISATTDAGLAEFAGAQLIAISAAAATALNTEQGVLVMVVKPSSPAAEAGLHAGDVVRFVNGVDVRDVVALSKALVANASDHAATLQVSAKSSSTRSVPGSPQGGLRTVVVRW